MKAALAMLLPLAGAARADTHGVTVVNSGSETIVLIEMGPAGGAGSNRLRSQVPPGAQARITYSTGCSADVRLGYAGGRMEAFPAVDVCSDPRIVSGQGVVSAGGPAATPPGDKGAGKLTTTVAAGTKGGAAATTPLKAPPPVVPPWTGKSITKRFGGME